MQTIISEVGVDMSRWDTEEQLASWLGLCPDTFPQLTQVRQQKARAVAKR